LINELAIIFNKLGIDTEAVLNAAGTKWNFLPFRPGLVGGHCIGVDPYYLTHKAESVGYHPEVILAGRRLNDAMGEYVAAQLVKAMVKKKIPSQGARILVMGLAFKENCPDLRNTKVVDVINELEQYGAEVDVFDPWIDSEEAFNEYSIKPTISPSNGVYDGVLVAVAHDKFRSLGVDGIKAFCKQNHVIYDLKYLLKDHESDARL
jgi:UDP-N-acetyl-D-galactosamine dehydrogenase